MLCLHSSGSSKLENISATNSTVLGNLNYNFECLFDDTLPSFNLCIFTNAVVVVPFLPSSGASHARSHARTLASLVSNSVEELSSGREEGERGSRFRCSIWMTIWNSLWRQETMQLGNLITISPVTAGAFAPSEHL